MAFRVNFSGLDAGNFLLEFASMVDSDSPENPGLYARIGDANATEGDFTGADDATVTALHVDIDGVNDRWEADAVNGIALMCLIGQPEGVCVGFTGEPDFKMAIKSQQ